MYLKNKPLLVFKKNNYKQRYIGSIGVKQLKVQQNIHEDFKDDENLNAFFSFGLLVQCASYQKLGWPRAPDSSSIFTQF